VLQLLKGREIYTQLSTELQLIKAGSEINDKDSKRVPTAGSDKKITIT
jgi:hypothetical protein